ncbi:plasmid mobilization relaxosome protein MobC [Phenylobacterium sp. VNQ135]|uniref:plasmid mobilization relaxosome protein MobC n=1 Tax=Phenylobacterium sp. VNQ135 TaxID=3400922 RepID=UPI003C0FC86E
MANLSVRVPDELLARFDVWAGGHGGRAPSLRRLMDQVAGEVSLSVGPLPARPLKLTVRLCRDDGAGLEREAASMGLTSNAWAAALIRHRLHGKPRFPRTQEVAVIAIQGELRRIGVNVNQIARALNTAVMEGKVLDLELAALEALRCELRAHIVALREAFAGNLAYWDTAA